MPENGQQTTKGPQASGIVDAVRGAVVDVVFESGALPPINSALIVQWDRPHDIDA